MGKQKYKKREDMIKKANSKIVYIDTKETELMFELLIKTNDVFKELRSKAGDEEIDIETANSIISKFQNTILKTSGILELISENIGYKYNEPLHIAKLRSDKEK